MIKKRISQAIDFLNTYNIFALLLQISLSSTIPRDFGIISQKTIVKKVIMMITRVTPNV